jgi:hypothetical protein
LKLPWAPIGLLAATIVYGAALPAQAPARSFLVTNDDQAPPYPTSAAFYTINADRTLAAMTTVSTRGIGIGGGFFAAARTIVTPYGTGACAYVSTPATSLIAGIDAMTHTVTGTFSGCGTGLGFVSTGFGSYDLPNGVAITKDGHYAIFGDASTVTTVEVSDISSGKLTPTMGYVLGKTWNSRNVRLSPDRTVLFISNGSAGQVTTTFFKGTTGKVTRGCTSGPLRGYYTHYSYVGNIGLQLATSTGGMIYVPEFGSGGQSYLALLDFTSNGATFTMTESASSPVTGSPNSAVLSITAYSAPQ